MLGGSSALARRTFGPNAVAKLWTLVPFLLEQLWTSHKNLDKGRGRSGQRAPAVARKPRQGRAYWQMHLSKLKFENGNSQRRLLSSPRPCWSEEE